MSLHRWGVVLVVSFAVGVLEISNVWAETPECPYTSNDRCDAWRVDQTDQEMGAVVAQVEAQIARFATKQTQEEAAARLREAQTLWMRLREADCRSEAAFVWMRSARTTEGYTASCMYTLATRRIGELKTRYLLRD